MNGCKYIFELKFKLLKSTLNSFSKFSISIAAKSVLNILQSFDSLGKLEQAAQTLTVYHLGDDVDSDFIELHCRPSNGGIQVPTISYTAISIGIPLEVKINSALQYSSIITKGDFELDTYELWALDQLGNKIQQKRIPADLKSITEELKLLVYLN